jgi:hypothetical protein
VGGGGEAVAYAEEVRTLGACALVLAAAFVVPTAGAGVAAPEPDLARLVPANYRVIKVLRSRLSGQKEPEVVVASVGPLNRYAQHPIDLQVFSWDSTAYRWNIIFDAQRTRRESAPLIDPRAAVLIRQLAFTRLYPAARRQLVFSVSAYKGTHVRTEVIVIDFWNGEARIAYHWASDSSVTFRVTDSETNQTLTLTAPYQAVVDAPSQPVRNYRITVGLEDGFLRVLHDDRPWLGLIVTGTDRSSSSLGSPRSHLRVLGIIAHAPASPSFRAGDVIVGLTGPRTATNTNLLGPALINKVAAQHAGDRISLAVLRGSHYLRITIKLGSLVDPSAPGTAPTAYSKFALV